MKPYDLAEEDTGRRYRNGSGAVTWRIVATGSVLALAAVVFFWLQNISGRLDSLTGQVGELNGEVRTLLKQDP